MSFFSHPIGRELHNKWNVDKLLRFYPGSCPHHIIHNLLNGSYNRHRFCTAEPFTRSMCKHGSHARPTPAPNEIPRLASGVMVPLGFGLFGMVGKTEIFISCPACVDDVSLDVACTACGMAHDGEQAYEADNAAISAAARRTLWEMGESGQGEEDEGEEEEGEEAWGEEAEGEEEWEEEHEEEEEDWQEEEEGDQEEEEDAEGEESQQADDGMADGVELEAKETSQPDAPATAIAPLFPAPSHQAAKRARPEETAVGDINTALAAARRNVALLEMKKRLAALQEEITYLQ